MNEVTHTWGDLLIQRSTRAFIGRENVIEHFRLNCLDTVPRDLVIVLQGIAGVGKSATIARLREIAYEYDIFSTYSDSSIATPAREKAILRLMDGVAQQFSANGIPLTQFVERYHEYVAVLQQISEDSEAPGRIFDAIGGLNDRATWYSQAWDTYLNERFSANVCTLVRHPIEQLTSIFVRDLNTWALVRCILLCFDDWQLLEDQLGAWLRAIMSEGKLSTKIWVILATRDALTADWDSLSSLLVLHTLTEFTETEIRTYLKGQGITDQKRVSDIIVFSDGLPVLVSLLSSAHEGIAGDLALSPLDRYFKWLSHAQRRVVLLASSARRIDIQVLNTVLGKEGGTWFDWLKHANLILKKGNTWIYHPVLRAQFLSWVRREMFEATYAAHVALRAYYLRSDSEGGADAILSSESISTSRVESIYHGLMIGESGAIRHAVIKFIQLLRSDYTLAGELVETWRQAAKAQENPNAVVEWTASLGEMWNAFYNCDWFAAAACCEAIQKRETLDAGVKSAVEKLYLAIQGRFPQPTFDSDHKTTPLTTAGIDSLAENRSTQRTELENVDAGDSLMPNSQLIKTKPSNSRDATTKRVTAPSASPDEKSGQKKLRKDTPSVLPTSELAHQTDNSCVRPDDSAGVSGSYQSAEEWRRCADIYLKEGAYAEALDAYGQALEMDPTLIKAHFGRASAFTQLENFTSAIQSYEAVLNAEPNNIFALRNRGWLYMRQHHYIQALKDYDRAVNLAPDDVKLMCARANAYYRQKDYTNALKGYDEAIRRDSAYAEAHLNRGVTHAVLQEYRRAIADFNQAITLAPNNGYAYHRRGRAYTKLQQLALAHNDYVRAIDLIPHFVGIYIDMGLLYTKQSEYEKALDVYRQAIVQEPGNATAYYNTACVAALLGDVEEACRKLDTAIELHPPYREMAATDSDFSSIRDTPAFQKRVGSL